MRFPVAFLFLAAGVTGCGPPSGPAGSKTAPPAKLVKHAMEANLLTVSLTPEAETRLGITTVRAVVKEVPRVRKLAGEAVVPPGREVIVSAPQTGLLSLPEKAATVRPGQAVTRGQPLFTLTPMLTAEGRTTVTRSRVDAAGALAAAQVEADAARLALARAEKLLQEEAGSQRAVDEARARHLRAEALVKAAQEAKDLLTTLDRSEAPGSAATIGVASPLNGVLTRLDVAPGQLVPAGTGLVAIAAVTTLWVRVPVYVGDWASLDRTRPARVGDLNGGPNEATRAAVPVDGPPSADAGAATVDLFYEVDNRDGTLRPGQRVGVTVFTTESGRALVVPWSAVLFDVHGGAWIYEKTGPRSYTRRRIEVRSVVESIAVLRRGPAEGTEVVTDGAAELFGTEFGTGK